MPRYTDLADILAARSALQLARRMASPGLRQQTLGNVAYPIPERMGRTAPVIGGRVRRRQRVPQEPVPIMPVPPSLPMLPSLSGHRGGTWSPALPASVPTPFMPTPTLPFGAEEMPLFGAAMALPGIGQTGWY